VLRSLKAVPAEFARLQIAPCEEQLSSIHELASSERQMVTHLHAVKKALETARASGRDVELTIEQARSSTG